MYRIQFFDRSCRILDDEDRIVFAGSFRECEEWLDLAENRSRDPKPAQTVAERDGRSEWLSRLSACWLVRLFLRRRCDTSIEAVPTKLPETDTPR